MKDRVLITKEQYDRIKEGYEELYGPTPITRKGRILHLTTVTNANGTKSYYATPKR